MRFNFLLILALLFMASCNGKGESSGISNGGQDDTTDDDDTTDEVACHESVVDAGLKSATTTSRGVVSSVALNPTNTREAFAYYDTGALSVKFSYWNGTKYVHELVAGYGTAANNISMVFLPGGVPVVAWTAGGTDVMLATRGAATSTASSSWSSRVISSVSGNTTRTIKLAVTPTGMVGGVYQTLATTSARLKLFLCTANCHLTANYAHMATTENVDTGSATNVAAQVAIGFAWCGADTNSDSTVDAYYPSAVYSRSATSARYTVCPSATPATCLTSAGWTQNAQYINTGNLAATLHIDPSVANDTPKILALKTGAGLGIKAYRASTALNGGAVVGCNAVTSATIFDESTQTLGGTTSGSLWLDLMRSSDGRLHAVANTSTTSVTYFNTANGVLTNWDTMWNAVAGGTLNTITTSGQGGAVLDSTNGILYSSHYANVATSRFNLLVNKIDNLPSNPSAVTSTNSYVNENGHIALSASVTRNVVLAKTSTGEVGGIYVDNSIGTTTTGVLKYAYRNNRLVDGAWTIVNLPDAISPSSPYLRYDDQDRPWVSYFDLANFRFYLAFNSETDGSGTWTRSVFPLTSTGIHVFPATNDTAIAMYQASPSGPKLPVLVVLDNTNTTRTVTSARFNPDALTWSAVDNIYAQGATGASGLDAHADSSGNVVVSFVDRTTGANNFLKYAHSSDGISFGTALSIGTVALAGQGTSIRLNPVTGQPIVVYHDRAANRLYRATCSGTPASCATSGWSTVIDDFGTGVSGLTITTTGNEALATSAIATRDNGSYDIFYTHGMAASGDLRRIKVDDEGTAAASATWVAGVGGNLAATMNFGVQGFHSDAVITPDNHLVSLFIGRGNLLVQRTCNLDLED